MKYLKNFEHIKWEWNEEEEDIKNKSNQIKIGTRVSFKKFTNNGIHGYYNHEPLKNYIRNGSPKFIKNRGVVINIVNDNNQNYYIVEYIDIDFNIVRLGFKVDDLELY